MIDRRILPRHWGLRHWAVIATLALANCSSISAGAEHPTTSISNGRITAKLYLPDEHSGYYRGARFDWAGIVYSLTCNGHEYFGEWQRSDDPYLHDRITGPVDSFDADTDVQPGERFLRIGAGICEKVDPSRTRWAHPFRVVDAGRWKLAHGKNWIEMTHFVNSREVDAAYRYCKRLTLPPERDELVIDYFLVNVGEKSLETSVYNHNFFVIDGQPTGPDFSIEFPFALTADRSLKGIAKTAGNKLLYTREVNASEHIFTVLTGHENVSVNNWFRLENRKSKAGVFMKSDRNLSKLNFWSPRTTLCPEPYIDIRIEPGQSDRWTNRYQFYTTK